MSNFEKSTERQDYIWCLVGNVKESSEENASRETKHFKAGAKVYCLPPVWGERYEKIYVIGLPWNKFREVKVTISSGNIVNWRKQKVYDKHIIQLMLVSGGWDYTSNSQLRLDSLYNSLIKRAV